ncbi:MAG: hypothetical protein J5816_02410 [Clostridia bacterium]|nr:hypothetical protein [Clostridia bacterium]
MKKTIKRTVLLFAAILFLFAASCSSAESSSEEVFDTDLYSVDKNVNLDGFEYKIRFYDHYVPEDGSLFGYRQSTEFNDAVIKRIKDVENAFNCKIVPSNGPGADLDSNILAILISGQSFYDTVLSSSWNLRPIIESGSFEPLSQVSDIIDYTDSAKWGNWRLLEQSVWDGDIYGVVPVQWPGMAVTGGWMFVFNERMAELLGQPDPREYIEDKSWSREKLGEMMLTYTTNDLSHPLKALLVYEGHFYDTALRANKAQTYKLVDGKYVSGYHTPEGLDALKWSDDFLHVDYADCTYQPCPGDSERNAIFINEDVAMFLSHVSNIFGANSEIPFEVENYCVLPMPNGPEREKRNLPYTTAFERVHANMFFPINGNLDYSALIANTLFEPLDGFGEEELKAYYLRYYYHDERDYDLAKEVFENGRYTFLSDGFRAPVVEALYGNHTRTVAEVLDATEESQNERVLKYIVPTVESLEEIFGAEALENN